MLCEQVACCVIEASHNSAVRCWPLVWLAFEFEFANSWTDFQTPLVSCKERKRGKFKIMKAVMLN